MHAFAALAGLAAASLLVPATPAEASSPRQKGEKLICKSQANAGTRFRTRICHSKAQWAQIEEENKRLMQDMTTRSINTCRLSCE